MLHQVKTEAQVQECPSYISADENTQAWKKAKERTSAGPSELHFGMFKAQAKQKHLSELDASL